MALSFSNSRLETNTTSSYKLDEFNGVDYTTTPTKVADNRAIDISNYLPEGNSLVKRYGYEKIVDLVPVLQGYTEYKVYGFNDTIVILCSKSSDIKIAFYVIERNELVYKGGFTRFPTPVFSYNTNCRNATFFPVGNKLYFFAFNKYWVAEYAYNETYHEYRYTVTNLIGEVNGYINTYNTTYIPTLALNYQPMGSTSKNVAYEQLNILNPKFKVELGFSLKATMNDNIITGFELLGNEFDIKSLIDRNITLDTTKFYIKYTPTDTLGYRCSATLANGIVTLTMDENTINNTNLFDTDDTYPSIVMEQSLSNGEGGEVYAYGKIRLQFTISDWTCADFMTVKVGTIYGVKNSADRIFAGSTDAAPHTDWHTLDDETGQPNFTYFGTDTYNAIGSNGGAIVGYSLLNDGSLAIFKDAKDVSNIYIRTSRIDVSNETYSVYDYVNKTNVSYNYVKAIEVYPTISTGLLVKTIDTNTKFCLYDNKLIFNTKDGIYYLSLNSTTSSQSYSAKELSYYVRNDLGNDLTDSSIETDGSLLYVSRKDKNGQLRVYVADKNRYSFINSEAQYNWWVLDGIPAYSMISLNNKLYFVNGDLSYIGLYSFSDNFNDYDYYNTSSATIGGDTFSTDIQFDTDSDKLIINSNGSSTWNELLNTYKYNRAIDKDNPESKYKYIKNNVSIKLSGTGANAIMNLSDIFDLTIVETSIPLSYTLTFSARVLESSSIEKEFLNSLVGNARICYKRYEMKVRTITSEYDGDYIIYTFYCSNSELEMYSFLDNNSDDVFLILKNQELKIKELYTVDGEKLSDYTYIVGSGWFDENADFYATTMDFRMASFTFNGIDVDFYNPDDTQVISTANITATFIVNSAVISKWYGKFTDFGTIDTLKSTKAIHFVPETRRGGYTTVGYRTRKTRTLTSDTTNLTTIRKYIVEYAKERSLNVRERMYNSLDLGINLNDIDFDNFSFESDYFARTYSSKKKIKNFAFIQLKFESDEKQDSTIASVTINYSYTKLNKGVK